MPVTNRSTFYQHYGEWPDVVICAPGRVNCIGDHTDYQGGWSLPIALALGTQVSLHWRSDTRVRAASELDGRLLESSIAELTAMANAADHERPLQGLIGFVAAAQQLTSTSRGFDLWVESDLPAGSGLSSSAALALGILAALSADTPDAELVRLAQRVENHYLGVNTGILDQTAIVYAQPGCAVLIDAGQRTERAIPFDFASAGYRFWIIDTKTPRSLAQSAYDVRVKETADAAALLQIPSLRYAAHDAWKDIPDPLLARRARHVITENQRVHDVVEQAAGANWEEVAGMLLASHHSLAEDFGVSTQILDQVVELVESLNSRLPHGAAGARLTGAGFGGSVVALLPAAGDTLLADALVEQFPDPVTRPSLLAIDRPAAGLSRA